MILQGNTYGLAIRLRGANGAVIVADDVEAVQFTVGDLQKYYGRGGSVEFDEGRQVFVVPLSEEETFAMSGAIEWQARVAFLDGTIDGTLPRCEDVRASLTRVPVLEGHEGE